MNKFFGLVLCGGKSSRLGFPKYKIEKEGVALYNWWANTLNTVCEKTYISCQTSQINDIDYPDLIIDESIDAGPLEGIYKAFQLKNYVSWLVIACDLVYAESKDITNLLNNNREESDAVCYENPETGEPFSLLTIYNPQIKSALDKEYHSDLKSARRLLIQSNTIQLIPSDARVLKGINTVEDLNNWKKDH